MRILIGKTAPKVQEIEYVNKLKIDFKFDGLNGEFKERYSEIIKNIRLLNKNSSVNISITTTNAPSLKELEVEYVIELKSHEMPTPELLDFYSNFSKYLIESKKKEEESASSESENQSSLDSLVKKYEISQADKYKSLKEKINSDKYLVVFKQKKASEWDLCHRAKELTFRSDFDYKAIHINDEKTLREALKDGSKNDFINNYVDIYASDENKNISSSSLGLKKNR
jgi:hypothetical protein